MLVPARTRRTHRGAPMPAVKPALTVATPAALRCWNVTPGAGVTPANTSAEFAASDVRIMTPAFAHAFVLAIDSTRVLTSKSPESC